MFPGTKANETQAQFSRDGHWVAYCSDESGGYEVYVRPFPPGTWQVKVSSSGGSQPRWSPDGKELYYLERTLGYGFKLMATGVRSRQDGTPDIGVPQRLFGFESVSTVPQANTFLYSPAPDGRFLVNVLADPTLPTINLITNWQNLAPGGK